MNTRPTPLHTRNGGNVVEDGEALKRRWSWPLFSFYLGIGLSFALGFFGVIGIFKIISACLK